MKREGKSSAHRDLQMGAGLGFIHMTSEREGTNPSATISHIEEQFHC